VKAPIKRRKLIGGIREAYAGVPRRGSLKALPAQAMTESRVEPE
jgi:hypothetical protein